LRDVAALRDVAWFARTGLQTLIAKAVVAARPASRRRPAGAVAFYTQFPGVWRGANRTRDEKYAGVPSLLERVSGIPALLACTFSSDGGHQSASLGNYLRSCGWWSRNRARQHSVHLTDADLRITDFVRAAAFLRLHWTFARLVRRKDFHQCWEYRGVDISPLIEREFRTAASRIPRYVLHALRTRRFVQRTRPSCFVAYLFEFCYGRAMLYGAKSADPDLPVVGVQHGPYAERKLYTHHVAGELPATVADRRKFIEHVPSPDAVVAESAAARDLLVASGYRPDVTTVGGAPRLGGLLDVPRREAAGGDDLIRVLVVFGQHDAASILAACAAAMKASRRFVFTFKLHPRSPFTPRRVREVLDARDVHDGYTIADESAYHALARTDVVLATYSSVAMEALARAYPVVCLLVPNRVNPSPLLDSSSPSGVFLTAGDDLPAALEQAARTRNDQINGSEIEYLLGPLDAALPS
jgi:surface carbohydrate biosynthesis protein (TIGR04326 family)